MNPPSTLRATTAVWLAALLLCAQAMGQLRRDEYAAALPTFSAGPHAGKHAVYEHEKFHAWITAKGSLHVQPLDAGKPVGKPFSCWSVSPYYSAKGTTYGRRVADFQEFGQPVVIPSKGGSIRISGRLVEEIPFTVEYTFEGNTIKARGGCRDRPSTKPSTTFRLITQFAATHRFSAETPTAQIAAATKGMTLESRLADGKSSPTYPYWQGLKGIAGPSSAMIVRGVFHPRVITFKPTGRTGRLQGYIYTGRRLCQGYYLAYTTQGKKIALSDTEATMIIE